MITSSNNQQLKNLALLMKKAKERRNQGLFVVEGPKMCFEAPVEWVHQIYVAESYYEDDTNRQRLEEYVAKQTQVTRNRQMDSGMQDFLQIVADSVFKSISDTQTPQGILATVRMPHYEPQDLLQGDRTLVLCLESVQDPGNLGTMVRTGEGAGVTGVIMNSTTVDLFNPKTIRSTMGSIYRVPYLVVEDLAGELEELKTKGVSLYAAHLRGTKSHDEPDYTGACGFLIGNEGNGLSAEIADLATEYIRIPMEGQVESLNAAMSAGILMYECNRQRRRNA